MLSFVPVDPLSLTSLLVVPRVNDQDLGTATCFIVEHKSRAWLVTSRHVVTGRDTETDKLLSNTGAVPDALRIVHHSTLSTELQGAWTLVNEPLYTENGEPRWVEHPHFCIKDAERPTEPNVDLVVLPLSSLHKEIQLYPLDLRLATVNVRVAPGLPVSIIGFPFGRFGPAFFPIWKTGHIASDADAYWSPRYFLIDATTRTGMSGSPVVYRSFGSYQRDETTTVVGDATRLLGVYSGRIREDAEIGIVWRPELISEMLDSAPAP